MYWGKAVGRLKRRRLVLIIPILLLSTSQAQKADVRLSIGVGAASGIYDQDRYNDSVHSENSYSVAALVEFPTSSNVRLRTGVKCYQTGQNVDVYFHTLAGPVPVNYDATLLYFAAPLAVTYNLPWTPSVYCIGGFEGAYLLSGSSIVERDDGSSSEDNTLDQFHTVTLSVVLGIGMEWRFDRLTFFLEPQYSRGLTDATDNAPLGLTFRTEGISLNAGLKW
jgi:hypothetical protein